MVYFCHLRCSLRLVVYFGSMQLNIAGVLLSSTVQIVVVLLSSAVKKVLVYFCHLKLKNVGVLLSYAVKDRWCTFVICS